MLEPQMARAGILIQILNAYSSLLYDVKQKSSGEIVAGTEYAEVE